MSGDNWKEKVVRSGVYEHIPQEVMNDYLSSKYTYDDIRLSMDEVITTASQDFGMDKDYIMILVASYMLKGCIEVDPSYMAYKLNKEMHQRYFGD